MRIRRIACALALPALPLALLASTLVSPTDSTRNAAQLRAATAHGQAWAAAAVLAAEGHQRAKGRNDGVARVGGRAALVVEGVRQLMRHETGRAVVHRGIGAGVED